MAPRAMKQWDQYPLTLQKLQQLAPAKDWLRRQWRHP